MTAALCPQDAAPIVAPRCRDHAPYDDPDCVACRVHRRTRTAYTRWSRRHRGDAPGERDLVDAAPVIVHVWKLYAAGMSLHEQADRSRVARSVLSRLASGDHPQVYRSSATALLALTPPADGTATGRSDQVNACGTRRRIQGLAVDGWSSATIAERLGITQAAVSHWMYTHRVKRATAEKIRAIADELDGVPGPNRKTRLYAERKGWHPLDAWTEETIDDPNAEPNTGEIDRRAFVDEAAVLQACSGDRPVAMLTKLERFHAVERMARQGMNDTTIAERLKWNPADLKKGTAGVTAYRGNHGIAPGRPRSSMVDNTQHAT